MFLPLSNLNHWPFLLCNH
uniref:Uncharacterized protein n=1 Tax=Anguilla anguilla TaxID=7936 RepID=A0A0E9X842_ANGAN